eukprot:m.212690 g.212690  ORF g.212690 m.212690 type:complete len:77 (+) comp26158_c0_seq3:1394-1624(+)
MLLDKLTQMQGQQRADLDEISTLRVDNEHLRDRVQALSRQLTQFQKLQNIRWSDLEQMASAVKDFTHDMNRDEDSS